MASKYDALRARFRSFKETSTQGLKNGLHAAETLVTGAVVAYASGRMSDEDGEWGFRKVPYPLLGAGALYLVGIFAGPRYGEDVFSVATGAASAWTVRRSYELGLEAKNKNATQGARRQLAARSMPAVQTSMQGGQQRAPAQQPRVQYGTAFDAVGGA